jgi:hypothetical protein
MSPKAPGKAARLASLTAVMLRLMAVMLRSSGVASEPMPPNPVL